MSEQLTLYTNKICPAGHRVELALIESKVKYTRFEIDLSNKPEWFATKVNPVAKVPAIAYGGPQVPPDQPSPESIKLAESLVLVEFIADLRPDSPIRPKDPVLCAKMRFFVDAVSTKLLPAYIALFMMGGPFEALWETLQALQALLPVDAPYVLGEAFTVADIAAAPLLVRIELNLKNDLGAYKAGEGPQAAEYLHSSGRFARLVKYLEAIKARDSFKASFDEEFNKIGTAAGLAPYRERAQATSAAATA
ncbi:hypothetical protein C8R43DRAFT_968873 [Mycena crocata]|nr:hypothetical protein C8R43DRAFT_968873 [Mycena crocata]